MKMLNGYVLIKPMEAETVTESGIITQVGEDHFLVNEGEVLSAEDETLIGKHVQYKQYAAIEYHENNQPLLIIDHHNITAIYE